GQGLGTLRATWPSLSWRFAMSSVLTSLDAEWGRIARSRRALRAAADWGARFPALVGCRELDAILDRRRDTSVTGPVLDALAALAPDDGLAARTLLQALLPGLVRLGRRHPAAGGVDEVIGLAWERIRTYPATRTGSVAGNVVLDVRKALWRQSRQA